MLYTSKRTQIQKKVASLIQQTESFDRKQFNLHCLTTIGASKGMIDSVLEVYAEAGALIITPETVSVPTKEE